MASVEPVHGGERITAAGGVDTHSSRCVPGAVPSALHTLTPESSQQPLRSRVQDGEGVCSGRPVSTGAARVLMLLPPLPVLPPKWTVPL